MSTRRSQNEPESRLVSWGSMLGEHEPTEQLARLA